MIFMLWGLIFCVLVISAHISSNEVNSTNERLKEALYESPVENTEETKGYLITDTYNKIGRRQVLIGITSIISLLGMFLIKPFNNSIVVVILYVLNGGIISALIGYTLEGLFLWNNPELDLSEDGGGENDN